MSENRAIEVGDRFESRDSRDRGRVVEVIDILQRRYWGGEWLRYFHLKTEAHPNNPTAVGTVSRINERSLETRYRRISR